ncbi:hypothetical protein A9Q99_15485 [Gammaproteobacteria bacterium 45_16_T64]|nr:hypothetical protein A9Q99_15485 [Gammaproteobacteria bacterium 45_16_T64]
MMITPTQVVALSKNSIFFNAHGSEKSSVVKRDSPFFPDIGKDHYHRCRIDTSGGGLAFRPVTGLSGHTAKHINFWDKKAAMARASDCNIICSGGFSGCVFQLWRDKDGIPVGVHAYKGTDLYADISIKARALGWQLLYENNTSGKNKSGMEIFVVAVIGDDNADVIVQRINRGVCDAVLDWHTVTKWRTNSIPALK